MSATESPPPPRFKLPFTFGGVASYGPGGWKQLLLVEICMAVLAAVCGLILVIGAWLPAVDQAVPGLPTGAKLQDGHLTWATNAPVVTLGETFALALVVDPTGEAEAGQGRDVQLTFRPDNVRATSLLGMMEFPYPRTWTITLERDVMVPRWGAWRPMLLGGILIGSVLWLMLVWAVLGLVYSLVVKVIALFSDREGNWLVHWRVGSASLLPGALVMSGAMLLYGLGRLPLVGLLCAFALHLVVGWVFLIGAPLRLKRSEAPGIAPKKNPFTPAPQEGTENAPAKQKKDDNPFH